MSHHFRHMRIEEATGERKHMLETVMAQLEGKPLDIAGTVGVNVLIHVIMSECESWEEVDSFIDQLADAMREGCRAQVRRHVEEHKNGLQ